MAHCQDQANSVAHVISRFVQARLRGQRHSHVEDHPQRLLQGHRLFVHLHAARAHERHLATNYHQVHERPQATQGLFHGLSSEVRKLS